MILFTIITWILFCIADAYEDTRYVVIKNHVPTLMPRIAVFILAVTHSKSPLLFAPILIFTFWLVFDLSYNLFKGNKPLYIGNTSTIDKILNGKEFPVFFFKVMLTIGSYMTYYYYR